MTRTARNLLFLLSAAVVLLAACATPVPPRDRPQYLAVAALVDDSGRSYCAAFPRTPTLIVTAAHCVRFNPNPKFRFQDGTRGTAARVVASARTDVAFLVLDRPLPERLVLAFADPERIELGLPVTAVGHPFGFRWTVTNGHIVNESVPVAEHVPDDAGRYLLAAIAIAPGNSGGPLLDAEGRVVGVTCYVATGYALGLFLRVDEIETERVAAGL